MASNQVSVAEKAKIISRDYRVPEEDVELLKERDFRNCTKVEAYIKKKSKKGVRAIPYDLVRQIQKKDIKDCTTIELKIRYNNPNLGKLIEEFDFDSVETIIYQEVANYRNESVAVLHNKEDLHNICWVQILLKSEQINKLIRNNENYLGFIRTLARNHLDNLRFFHRQHCNYEHFTYNLNAAIQTVSETDRRMDKGVQYYHSGIVDRYAEMGDKEFAEELKKITTTVGYSDGINNFRQQLLDNRILDIFAEELSLVESVKAINDTTMRDLISITAYILAGIDGFKQLYIEAVQRMEKEYAKNIEDRISKSEGKITFKELAKLLIADENLVSSYVSKSQKYIRTILNNRVLADNY